MNANNINLEFIERYQKLFEKDPQSKVFAPLGEAYRKMGMQKEALEILKRGVRMHPNFPSGRVALAKVYMDQQKFEEAANELMAATEVSPENILAHRLLADCQLMLRQTKKALKSYKMVLFLNPNDAQAQTHVKKLESLTADEYDDEVFEMKPLRPEMAPSRTKSEPVAKLSNNAETATYKERQLERILSLTDAFITRLDFDRALETLNSAQNQIGKHPEIEKRKNFIQSRINQNIEETSAPLADFSENTNSTAQRIDILQNLLQKIDSRRN
mgnify:CR=1 FL=1